MRILCASNMFPSAREPDYGAFVKRMCEALEGLGHEVVRAVIDTRRTGPIATPAKYAGLVARTLRHARSCDVIYAHYVFPTGGIAATAGRLARRPWVLTAHGQDVRNLGRPAIRRASRGALAGASTVVAVSEHLAEGLRASGLRVAPIEVVNMGVDLDRFVLSDPGAARAALGIQHDAELVIAVGGLTERKNPLTLLRAIAELGAARPRLRVAFVGSGPLAGAVRAEAELLGIAERVTMAGAVSGPVVARWMAASDLLCLPSLVEPLGVVALEALASGRPVVATRVGGAVEVVPASGVGRIVDPTDPDGIADAIASVLDAPPEPGACREVAVPHGVGAQAERIAAILARATEGRRGRGG